MAKESLKNPLAIRYQLDEIVGQGSYGTVYKALDIIENRVVALKTGSLIDITPLEISIVKALSENSGFPTFYHSGRVGNIRYISMQLLGKNYSEYLKDREAPLEPRDISILLLKVLKRLKTMHKAGFVHRDLKLQHFIYNLKGSQVYLTDFGLSAPVPLANAKLIPVCNTTVGNPKFCSIRAHKYMNVMPIDDLESLVYIAIYLINGCLPWDSTSGSPANIFALVKECKIRALELGWRQQLPDEFNELLTCTRNRPMNTIPDYKQIKFLITLWGLKARHAYSSSSLDYLSPRKVLTKDLERGNLEATALVPFRLLSKPTRPSQEKTTTLSRALTVVIPLTLPRAPKIEGLNLA